MSKELIFAKSKVYACCRKTHFASRFFCIFDPICKWWWEYKVFTGVCSIL